MSAASDPYDLERFVSAQNFVFDRVLAELKAGRKTSHWMWFVFPQIDGLGASFMSQKYAIPAIEEARDYLAHPVLGPRLRQCVGILLGVTERSAHDIFGSPDDMKLQSSLTLFARAAPDEALFAHALDRYFDGKPDQATMTRLAIAP